MKVKIDPKERERNIRSFKDIKTLKRIMTAYSADWKDIKRAKNYSVENEIEALKKRLSMLRGQQRNRDNDRLRCARNFATEEEGKIRYKFASLCEKRKFSLTTTVGGKETGTCEYKPPYNKYSKAEVSVCLGHMWWRNVYQNFYNNDQMVSKEYLILSAIEYRTNVPHVRLFQVTAYGINEKKQVNGWVGQSKLGKQRCCFRTDRVAAIQAAQKLTVGTVTKHLQGEQE